MSFEKINIYSKCLAMLFANNNKLFNNTVNLIKIFQLSGHFDYFKCHAHLIGYSGFLQLNWLWSWECMNHILPEMLIRTWDLELSKWLFIWTTLRNWLYYTWTWTIFSMRNKHFNVTFEVHSKCLFSWITLMKLAVLYMSMKISF